MCNGTCIFKKIMLWLYNDYYRCLHNNFPTWAITAFLDSLLTKDKQAELNINNLNFPHAWTTKFIHIDMPEIVHKMLFWKYKNCVIKNSSQHDALDVHIDVIWVLRLEITSYIQKLPSYISMRCPFVMSHLPNLLV